MVFAVFPLIRVYYVLAGIEGSGYEKYRDLSGILSTVYLGIMPVMFAIIIFLMHPDPIHLWIALGLVVLSYGSAVVIAYKKIPEKGSPG